MPPQDYELGKQIGALAQKIDGLIVDTKERHLENRERFITIEKTALTNAERVNTLWSFRNRILGIVGGIALAGGFAAHFLSDAATALFTHFLH
jgi:hypothetical protein